MYIKQKKIVMKLKFLNSCMAVMRYKIRPIPGHVDVFQEHKIVVDLLYHNYYCYLKTVFSTLDSYTFPVPKVL